MTLQRYSASSNGGYRSRTIPIVASICLYSAFLSSTWTVMFVMISESFPTKVRSAATALCAASGRIASIVTQYVNGSWVDHDQPLVVLLIGSCVLLFGAMISCVVPLDEMTHRPIRDDDKDAVAIERIECMKPSSSVGWSEE